MDWLAMPPLSALRAFAAYAETGSVTAAGAALNVSHAAISQQIRNLEDHLGAALLDRTGRQAELTAEGRALARALSEGFGQIAAAVEALTGRDRDRPVQISTTPGFAAAWLMPRLGVFQAAHPDVGLMIDPTPEVRRLEPGGIDLAIRYGRGTWPGHDAEILQPSTIVTVAAPELLEAEGVTPGDLAALRQLPWLQEFGTTEASRTIEELGIGPGEGLRVTSLPGNLMLDGLRAGRGVGSMARAVVEPDIAAGRLVVLHEAGGMPGETREGKNGYWIVTRPGVLRPPVKAVLRWLRREAAEALSKSAPSG